MNEILKEFEDLITMGAVTKEVKIGNHIVVLSTLDYDSYSNVLIKSEDSKSDLNILASAIVSIGGKKLSYDDKKTLLNLMQLGTIGLLSREYEKLVKEQNDKYEDVKKNSLK